MAYLSTLNPLSNFQFSDRKDFVNAVNRLLSPLLPHMSEGGAAVNLGSTGVIYSEKAQHLEAFARPLFALIPLALGGEKSGHLDRCCEGITNGTDPEHPEFWGWAKNDQRMVEMAVLGYGLAAVPEKLWAPLSPTAKDNLVRWLLSINEHPIPPCNWEYFRIMVNVGLRSVGREYSAQKIEDSFTVLEEFYTGSGWYSDGVNLQFDSYVGMAFHFYSLLYVRLTKEDPCHRHQALIDRAIRFAKDYKHWFDTRGAAVPFGRSLTYRFAQGAFWGGLVFADIEALPWGEIKGIYCRHLRYWSTLPICARDGVINLGYAYENQLISDEYNASGSPYWCMKFFSALAQGESHPFWAATEEPLSIEVDPIVQEEPGFIISAEEEQTLFLSGRQFSVHMRQGPAKYAKFAYSSRYGFSVESDHRSLRQGAFDSMLAIRTGQHHWSVRECSETFEVINERIITDWSPVPGVKIRTVLWGECPWHVRIHRIICEIPLEFAEGGFAIQIPGYDAVQGDININEEKGSAKVEYSSETSVIERLDGVDSAGEVLFPLPSTNVINPCTVLPTLKGKLSPGKHLLACIVIASANRDRVMDRLTNSPDIKTEVKLSQM